MGSQSKRQKIEYLTQHFLDLGAGYAVVIRSGSLGACSAKRSERPKWTPAYYQSSEKVVDVTGAGNAFLAGLIAGLHQEKNDIGEACMYGSVSASYVIEQYGLPSMGADGRWNGSDRPLDRLGTMQMRYSPVVECSEA